MGDNEKQGLETEANWSAFVTTAEANNNLIVSYRQGFAASEIFAQSHGEFNKVSYRASCYTAESIWRLKCGFFAVLCFVVLIGAYSVQEGDLPIGGYVVLMNT